jgi:hypothetical protein
VSAEPDAVFVNPSRLFQDGARAKQAHREFLAAILTGSRTPEDDADLVLDDAAYERFVDDVAESVVAKLREQRA